MSDKVYTFDPRPLTDRVDWAEARAFARRLREQGRVGNVSGAAVIGVLFIAVTLFVFGSFLVSVVVGLASSSAATGGGLSVLITLLPLVVFGGIAVVVVVFLVRAVRGSSERLLRLDRFARANGLTYVPQVASPGLPGMIFGQGSDRQSLDVLRGDRPRFVEFANYRYTTGSGKNRTTHQWGYVAVKLDVPLPHIVLDATGNNGLFGSNLPVSFDRDQRLGLEGDFDRYFSLYSPAGYERDALYLFTPDIMARFIDNAAALDVEIVDDWLFLYAKRDFSTLDPATWAWLFSVVGALLDKLAQWGRWRDDRVARETAPSGVAPVASGVPPVGQAGQPAASGVGTGSAVPLAVPPAVLRPPPGVAKGGRRLRKGVPWGAVVSVTLIALWWLMDLLGIWDRIFP
jgi:hypothetical protein